MSLVKPKSLRIVYVLILLGVISYQENHQEGRGLLASTGSSDLAIPPAFGVFELLFSCDSNVSEGITALG